MSDGMIFHLVAGQDYRDMDAAAPYKPATFDADGFIQCTDGIDNVAEVGNRYFKDDRRMYVVLVIDPGKLQSPVKYEDAGRIYPHIYGPLNRDAITAILPVLRNSDGSFLPPNLRPR